MSIPSLRPCMCASAALLECRRRVFWSLNEDILKIAILKTNTPYPSKKIRHIRACTHQRPHRIKAQYALSKETQYAVFKKRHFKTLSLDELKSPDFNLLSDQEYSEEEEAEAMAETMEKYMSKTRTDYGSGVAMPKIDNKDQFELKWQFLKEIREKTFSDHNWWEDLKTKFLNKYCPPGRTAKKMEEINNFQQEPDETLYQAWERFKELLMKCPQHYLTEMQEVILFYNGLDVPTRQILDSRGVVPTKTAEDAKKAIQEMAEYSQKWHNGTSRGRSTETSDGLAAIQAQLNNLGREIKKVNEKVYAAQVGCEQCKGPHYTKDFPLKEEGKTLEEAYYTRGNYGPKSVEAYGASHINDTIPQKEKDPGSFTLPCFINNTCFDNARVDLGASVSVFPLSAYLNLGLGELTHTRLTVELADRTVKYPKGIAEIVLVGIGKFTFPVDFIILDMLEDMKVPLILGRPFLSTTYAKIDVYKRKITLRIGEENIILKSVKPASSLIKRVYMLRDDLMPTIKEGEVIEEFRTRDEDLDTEIDDYPSYCDVDKKTHIDCAHNLKFSCMIGFEFTHVNFFLLLYVNVMSKKFHNLIMKDKMVYKGNNVVGALMNVPIFVRTFSVLTDFAVLEDMDAYRDEGIGDVIVGEPFLREVEIKAKRFDEMITIMVMMK
ncbi:reverse transcriptase domain-containing protein [Tanacetum coccineum]